jgi:hypothetical protein
LLKTREAIAMTQEVPPLRVSSTDMRWFGRWLARALFILILFVLLGVLLAVWGPSGGCGCEHDHTQGTPPPVQTPMAKATPAAFAERSYENTCDGAQAYFDDLHEATRAHDELATPMFPDGIEFYLAYYRSSNPPPIVEEWTDANISFWAALSDFAADTSDLDPIHAAEKELEDLCEDHEFVEDFWG